MRTLLLVLVAAFSATPDPETLPATASYTAASSDLAAAMDQAHVAFCADDAGRIVGGHSTDQAVLSSDDEASLPVSTRGEG